jgi:uncharacterized Rossmann fold enzyme
MAHGDNIHHQFLVKYLVDHAVVTGANAPQVLNALEFAATGRAGILSQGLDLKKYPIDDASAESLQVLSGGLSKCDGVLRH